MTVTIKNFINVALVLMFLAHGVLYFLFPDHLYNEGSWIKLIKFVILILLFFLNFSDIRKKQIFSFLIFIVGIFLLLLSSHMPSAVFSGEGLKRVFLYAAPLFMIVLTPALDKFRLGKIPIYVTIIGVIFGFLEYFFFKGIFSRFDFSNKFGFVRVVSIFVNPNNAGLILSLGFIYTYDYIKGHYLFQSIGKIILLFSIAIVIFFTGSKTPLIIISLYLLARFLLPDTQPSKAKMLRRLKYPLLFLIIGLPIVLLFEPNLLNLSIFSSGREFSLHTAYIRQNQISDFFEFPSLDSFLAPNYIDISKTYDIMYLQIWSDLGFFGLIFFILIMLYVYVKRIRYYLMPGKITFFLLLMSGFSLSFLIIWPTAYIFWYLISSNNFFKNEQI